MWYVMCDDSQDITKKERGGADNDSGDEDSSSVSVCVWDYSKSKFCLDNISNN